MTPLYRYERTVDRFSVVYQGKLTALANGQYGEAQWCEEMLQGLRQEINTLRQVMIRSL